MEKTQLCIHTFPLDEPLAIKVPVTNAGSHAYGVSKDTAVRAALVPTLILPKKIGIFFLKQCGRDVSNDICFLKKSPNPMLYNNDIAGINYLQCCTWRG